MDEKSDTVKHLSLHTMVGGRRTHVVSGQSVPDVHAQLRDKRQRANASGSSCLDPGRRYKRHVILHELQCAPVLLRGEGKAPDTMLDQGTKETLSLKRDESA